MCIAIAFYLSDGQLLANSIFFRSCVKISVAFFKELSIELHGDVLDLII